MGSCKPPLNVIHFLCISLFVGPRSAFDPNFQEFATQSPRLNVVESQDGNLAAADTVRRELEGFRMEPPGPGNEEDDLRPPTIFSAARRAATPPHPPSPRLQGINSPQVDSFGTGSPRLPSQNPVTYYSPQGSPAFGVTEYPGQAMTTRTISAGAFKRSGEASPTGSGPQRKWVPPSPLTPQRRASGDLYNPHEGPPDQGPSNGGPAVHPHAQRLRREDDVGSMTGSLQYEELPRYQSDGGHSPPNAGFGSAAGILHGNREDGTGGGYGSGNFSTRLD
jgi:hypothetical protein